MSKRVEAWSVVSTDKSNEELADKLLLHAMHIDEAGDASSILFRSGIYNLHNEGRKIKISLIVEDV